MVDAYLGLIRLAAAFMKAAAKRINPKYASTIEGTRKRIKEEGLPIDQAIKEQEEKFSYDSNRLHYRDLITGQGIAPWSNALACN